MAVGVWVAAELVVDFRLDGTTAEQFTAVLVVAAVFFAVVEFVALPARWLLGRAAVRWAEEPDWGASDWKFFVMAGLSMVLQVLVLTAVGPAGLWAAVQLCAAVGLPVSLPGLWPLVAAALVVSGSGMVLLHAFDLPIRRLRGPVLCSLAGFVLCGTGLALAAALMNAVRFEPSWSWLALAALTGVFHLRIRLTLPVPGVASAVQLALNAVALWLVVLLAGLMEPSLHIDGFWPLMATAALMWSLEWPARLAESVVEARSHPPPTYDWSMPRF